MRRLFLRTVRAALVAMMGLGCAGVAVSMSSTSVAAQVISNIEVKGNRRVDAASVINYLRLRRGQRYDAFSADESFKALFATGLFSDVKINMRGSVLVVEVAENPLINRVAFEGNKKIKDNVLQAEVESKERAVLTRARVQSDVQRILVLYRRSGRFAASVEPKIISRPQNRVDLVFEVDEGDKTKVSSINFIGNRAFSDHELNREITTRESGLLSFMTSNDVYDPDRLAADQELLRRFYLKHGYVDFEVVSAVADLDRERNTFFITITVDEGQEYRFGGIDLVSNVASVDTGVLEGAITTFPGDVYNVEEVDNTLEDITLELARRGYAFARVRPRGDRDAERKEVSITYYIEEGPRVYIERINVIGNTRTHDEVIRREFDVGEGDAYNRVMIDRAERRLKGLDYFEKVEINNEPGSAPDRVIVNVMVEEKATGSLSLGAGYSTSDGVIGDISISERNLLGRGQFVRLAFGASKKNQNIEFSFTEPYFLGRRVAAGFDVFATSSEEVHNSSYSRRRKGGRLRLGFPLSRNWTLNTRYTFIQDDVRDVKDSASRAIKQAAGKSNVSMLGYSLVYDTRDIPRDPKNGFFFEFSQDFAGVGGDIKFVRSRVEARAYHELVYGIVGLLRVHAGHIEGYGGDDVRMIDAFYEGPDVVRGFESAGLGPRDALTKDALGAKLYAGATAELQFPIPFISEDFGFRGAVFADAGVVYKTDLKNIDGNGDGDFNDPGVDLLIEDSDLIRSSVGVGIIWHSPFGPLRADFAHVVKKADFDETQFFRFSGGTRF